MLPNGLVVVMAAAVVAVVAVAGAGAAVFEAASNLRSY